MDTRQVNAQDITEYQVFPSADFIKRSGFLGGNVVGNSSGFLRLTGSFSGSLPITHRHISTDEFDSFLELNMNELDYINATRSELQPKRCASTTKKCKASVGSNHRAWEDAVVDCRIELPDDTVGENYGMKNTDNCTDISTTPSFYHSFTRKHMFYDSGGDDDDELMYLPSSSGIHGTHCLSHKDPCERNGDVSPTRCFSRISKRSKMQSLMSRRASDQWKAQPITPLTDKAIASEFAKFTQVGTEHLGFDNYFAHFHDEDVGKIIKEPNTLTVVPKNDWNPRDIKMCSPFKACRGEASKVSKSGGPIYGSGFNNESGKPLETARPPLEGLFMVTADVDSDDDIESYERLYKAEFDLLVERGERVDLQEMDEWLYQAGLTGPQIKNHNNAFSSMLRLNCKYFGKRVYPYKGELDSMASKTLHVLNPHTNDFEAGPTIAIPDKHDLKKMKKRQLMDTESTAENSASDRIPGNSVAIATIPASTYRLFDCETQPRFIHDPSLKIGASNVRQLYKKETADGFIRCPSTGLRQAISDFQSVPSANEDSSGTIEASKPESPTSTKDKGGNPDASLMSQRNFILKILLRFPYLDLKQLGLTSF